LTQYRRVTDGQMDGQTDRIAVANTALAMRALRAVKNGARFRYTRSRDYQTPTRHALLGSGSS